MEEEAIQMICDEIKKGNKKVILSQIESLKFREIAVDYKILLSLTDYYLKNENKEDILKHISEFNPKNIFRMLEILEDKNFFIKKEDMEEILKLCMIKCCIPGEDVYYMEVLEKCFDKLMEIGFNPYTDLEIIKGIKNIKNVSEENYTAINTYLNIIRILISKNINNIKKVNQFLKEVNGTINNINGNFLIINENGEEIDILYKFYGDIKQLKPELFSYEYINMAQTFVKKGSQNTLGILLDIYKELEKEKVSGNIVKLMNNKIKLMMEFCDKYEFQDALRLLLPYLFEKGDKENVTKYLSKYCDAIEKLKNSNNLADRKAYYEVAKELIRFIDGIIEYLDNFPDIIDKLEDLCDNFPYNYNYGNGVTTDYIKISRSRVKFNEMYNEICQLKNNINKNEKEIVELNKKSINFDDEDEINKIVIQRQKLADEMEKNKETLDNKIKKFFCIIENENLDYSFISENIKNLEDLENLNPIFKGKANETLKNIVKKQFNEKINSLNKLFSNDNNKNEKIINRELTSLAKIIGEKIISEKYAITFEDNELDNLDTFINNLEKNNISIYKEEFERLKEKLENTKKDLKQKNETLETDNKKIEEDIDNVTNNLSLTLKKEEQFELKKAVNSVSSSAEDFSSKLVNEEVSLSIEGNL